MKITIFRREKTDERFNFFLDRIMPVFFLIDCSIRIINAIISAGNADTLVHQLSAALVYCGIAGLYIFWLDSKKAKIALSIIYIMSVIGSLMN